MKKSIKLSALFLLLSASVFAGTTTKEIKTVAAPQVSFAGSHDVSLNVNTNSASTVRFYDADNHLLIAENVKTAKAFNLSNLDNGTYMVKISTGEQEVSKKVVVYEERHQKSFFIVQ